MIPIRFPQAVGKREWVNALFFRANNFQKAKRWEEAIPIWKKLDELTKQDNSVNEKLRTEITQGLVDSYRSTDRADLADKYSEELSD